MPIELVIEKEHGKNLKPQEFRDLCRTYAREQVESQKKNSHILGVIRQFDKLYLTMNNKNHAIITSSSANIHERCYIYPVVKQ